MGVIDKHCKVYIANALDWLKYDFSELTFAEFAAELKPLMIGELDFFLHPACTAKDSYTFGIKTDKEEVDKLNLNKYNCVILEYSTYVITLITIFNYWTYKYSGGTIVSILTQRVGFKDRKDDSIFVENKECFPFFVGLDKEEACQEWFCQNLPKFFEQLKRSSEAIKPAVVVRKDEKQALDIKEFASTAQKAVDNLILAVKERPRVSVANDMLEILCSLQDKYIETIDENN